MGFFTKKVPLRSNQVSTAVTQARLLELQELPGVVTVRYADGPMQDTLEQLEMCKQQGLMEVTVVFDYEGESVVDGDLCLLVEMEMRELLDKYGFDGQNATVIR
ncbi:MAG: hypothetical protein FWG47_02150 [Propionibacteriaceae bacterium]|nr:hypothetical protein [Propionibacteriaceae bacterium]